MANETHSSTPAQIQESRTLLDNFIGEREDQLGEARHIVEDSANKLRGAGDQTAEVYRVANIEFGAIRTINYVLMHSVQKRDAGWEAKLATLEVDEWHRLPAEMLEQFELTLNETPQRLILLSEYVGASVGQITETHNADFTSYTHTTRIY